MPEFEPIVGRYFTMSVAGDDVRVYVEEAGSGIPLVLRVDTTPGSSAFAIPRSAPASPAR